MNKKAGRKPSVSSEVKLEILQKKAEGTSVADLTKEYNISANTIYQWLRSDDAPEDDVKKEKVQRPKNKRVTKSSDHEALTIRQLQDENDKLRAIIKLML